MIEKLIEEFKTEYREALKQCPWVDSMSDLGPVHEDVQADLLDNAVRCLTSVCNKRTGVQDLNGNTRRIKRDIDSNQPNERETDGTW